MLTHRYAKDRLLKLSLLWLRLYCKGHQSADGHKHSSKKVGRSCMRVSASKHSLSDAFCDPGVTDIIFLHHCPLLPPFDSSKVMGPWDAKVPGK